MKNSIVYVATNIVIKAPDSMKIDDSLGVEAWASFVKAFDSLCYPIMIGNKELLDKREKIKEKVKSFRPKDKDKFFDAYNVWFRLLCEALHRIDAYPEKKAHIVLEDK